MLNINLQPTEDGYSAAQRQDQLEREALKLAAAWSDFDMVEHSATEIVRRFGAIRAADQGLLRLHKEPMFVALQTACIVGYTRPYTDSGGLDAKYANYPNPTWQDLHETLFVWQERLLGNFGISFRQFLVARESDPNCADHYILGEVTSTLKPLRHFGLLREMCADRKALLWKDFRAAIGASHPALYDQTLLSLSRLKIRS